MSEIRTICDLLRTRKSGYSRLGMVGVVAILLLQACTGNIKADNMYLKDITASPSLAQLKATLCQPIQVQKLNCNETNEGVDFSGKMTSGILLADVSGNIRTTEEIPGYYALATTFNHSNSAGTIGAQETLWEEIQQRIRASYAVINAEGYNSNKTVYLAEKQRQDEEQAAKEAEEKAEQEKLAAAAKAEEEARAAELQAAIDAKPIGRYKKSWVQSRRDFKHLKANNRYRFDDGQLAFIASQCGDLDCDLELKPNGYFFKKKGDELGNPLKYKIKGRTLLIQDAETGEFKPYGNFNGNRSQLTIIEKDRILERY